MSAQPTCTSCGGELVSGRRFRLGPPFVALGFGGILVAMVGVLGSLIMIFSGIDRLEAMLLEEMAAPRLEVLRVAGVPEGVVRKVADAETVPDAERSDLTDHQLRLITEARQRLDARRASVRTAAESTRVRFIVIAAASTVVGLLCLPLLMRKEIRECPRCDNPVP